MIEKQIKEKEYTKYINEHIMNIRLAFTVYGDILCKKLNIPNKQLILNINNHDLSKYSEEEFDGYRQYFYPCSNEIKNEELFNRAWKHHYEENKHHPEFWVDSFTNEITDMPPTYIAEMLLDWEAMSIKFSNNTYDYYKKERNKKPLSDNTKKIIDNIIDIFKE